MVCRPFFYVDMNVESNANQEHIVYLKMLPTDEQNRNKFSKIVLDSLATIPFGKDVTFKMFNTSGSKRITATNPGDVRSEVITEKVPKVYEFMTSLLVRDPFLKRDIMLSPIIRWGTTKDWDRGVDAQIIPPRSYRFEAEYQGIITLSGDNDEHQLVYQYLQLHPDNERSLINKLIRSHGLPESQRVSGSFKFYEVEDETVYQQNLAKKSMRIHKVRDDLMDMMLTGNRKGLQLLYVQDNLHGGNGGEVNENISTSYMFNVLNDFAAKKPENFEMAIASPEILIWRAVYKLMASNVAYSRNGIAFVTKGDSESDIGLLMEDSLEDVLYRYVADHELNGESGTKYATEILKIAGDTLTVSSNIGQAGKRPKRTSKAREVEATQVAKDVDDQIDDDQEVSEVVDNKPAQLFAITPKAEVNIPSF